MSTTSDWALKVVAPFMALSIAFGSCQFALGREVAVNGARIMGIEKQFPIECAELKQEIKDCRVDIKDLRKELADAIKALGPRVPVSP